jgi:hypothetical protein
MREPLDWIGFVQTNLHFLATVLVVIVIGVLVQIL